MAGVNNVASVSLNIGYPTLCSVPHSIANGLKKCLAVAAATEITFPAAEKMKEYLADPSAFASAVVAEVVEDKKDDKQVEEDEESSDGSMGMGLFD